MRVLVFGGRDFTNRKLLFKAMDSIHAKHKITSIIEGKARGANSLAYDWAVDRGIASMRFGADWDKYGRSAGPIRNTKMIVEGKPDLGVSFPGGIGTNNMLGQLNKHGIKVLQIIPK